MTLSLFHENSPLAVSVIEGSSSIHAVVDGDGDGRDEVVMVSGFTNQGAGSEWARVLRIGAGGLTVEANLGDVLKYTYGEGRNGYEERVEEYAILHARRHPGARTEYWLEKRKGACPDGGKP